MAGVAGTPAAVAPTPAAMATPAAVAAAPAAMATAVAVAAAPATMAAVASVTAALEQEPFRLGPGRQHCSQDNAVHRKSPFCAQFAFFVAGQKGDIPVVI